MNNGTHLISRREFLAACSTAAAAGRPVRCGIRWRWQPSSTADIRWRRGRRTMQPKAEHLIFIFLTGGFSHVDTFDPKPKLTADHGKTVAAEACAT